MRFNQLRKICRHFFENYKCFIGMIVGRIKIGQTFFKTDLIGKCFGQSKQCVFFPDNIFLIFINCNAGSLKCI